MPIKNPSTSLRTGIVTNQRVTKEKLERAKELRREMTPAEKLLWQEVRANKLGVHFRRQQIIQGFIVDFYCHKAGLVIEVDGDVHDLQKEEDERWEKVLSAAVGRIKETVVRTKSDPLRVALCFYVVMDFLRYTFNTSQPASLRLASS